MGLIERDICYCQNVEEKETVPCYRCDTCGKQRNDRLGWLEKELQEERERHPLVEYIPVPREQYERMERALWVILEPQIDMGMATFSGLKREALFVAGFIAEDIGSDYLTPAAHEFAARMKEKE